MEVNLSILGSGRIIKYFNTESLVWKAVGHLTEEQIRIALYSEEFNKLKLNLPNGKSASTFFEIFPDVQYIAYDCDRISRLEIKVKNKSRSRLFFNEIVSGELLFPLYNYTIEKSFPINDKGLLIIENDIGHFGRCKLREESFEIDQIEFEIVQEKAFPKHIILKINYKGKELVFRKRENLFNGSVIVIKK